MDTEKFEKSEFKEKIQEIHDTADAFRADKNEPTDVDFSELVQQYHQCSMDSYFEEMGIDPSRDTINNIMTLPDRSVRWLVPEIIRDAIKLGLRKNPIYSELIAAEQSVSQTQVTMPHWNISESKPYYVGEAETIPIGSVSYGSKDVKLEKMGRGFKVSDEVQKYVAVNIVSVFLQDFGIKLGHALDTLLIDVLVNGEQSGGSESAAVVGVDSTGSIAYKDLLKVWIRMSRLGRNANAIIGGEDTAINTLNLPEFKDRAQGGPQKTLNLKTPIPQSADYYVHGAVSTDQQIVVDSSSAIIKLDSQALMVEDKREVSNQTEEFYASLTTGFAVIYRDARTIIDDSLDFSSNGFPSWMDVDNAEVVEPGQ